MYEKMSILCHMDQQLYKAQRMVSFLVAVGHAGSHVTCMYCAGPDLILYDVKW